MVGSFPFIGFIFDEFSRQTPAFPVNVKNSKTRFTLAKAGGCYPEGGSFSEALCSDLESRELRYVVDFSGSKSGERCFGFKCDKKNTMPCISVHAARMKTGIRLQKTFPTSMDTRILACTESMLIRYKKCISWFPALKLLIRK